MWVRFVKMRTDFILKKCNFIWSPWKRYQQATESSKHGRTPYPSHQKTWSHNPYFVWQSSLAPCWSKNPLQNSPAYLQGIPCYCPFMPFWVDQCLPSFSQSQKWQHPSWWPSPNSPFPNKNLQWMQGWKYFHYSVINIRDNFLPLGKNLMWWV